MNWTNIDLNDAYERSQDILNSYDSDTLLLEISCNIKDITKESVREQAMLSLRLKYEDARQIIEANLDNFTAYAIAERNKP